MLASFIAVVIATGTTIAQFGTFDPSFDGDLWTVGPDLVIPSGSTPAGMAFSNGTLFVADTSTKTVIAYNSSTGQVVLTPSAQWNGADSQSPVAGLVPHQITAVVITVNGVNRNALLVSDKASHRVAAFDTNGAYLFTLRLTRPPIPIIPPATTEAPTFAASINEMALAPGAHFILTTGPVAALTLSGNFVAGWSEQVETGSVYSGALVYGAASSFTAVGGEFEVSASTVLDGRETDPVAPQAIKVFGVEFDTIGNLYILDAFTERLNVYAPNLTHLFTFGTPVADGTTAEFHEPYGLAFWPDATGTGGRMFISDTYKHRIMVYRTVNGPDYLHLETVIRNFPLDLDVLDYFSLAVDPATGRIAYSDARSFAQVLHRARLAAFNLQILDAQNNVVESVCTATDYKVRFSLTVPSGLAAVTGVAPTLLVDPAATAAGPVAGGAYSSTLAAGEVATYTYTLTSPSAVGADVHLVAGAIAGNTNDILARQAIVSVGDCAHDTQASTITATPSRAPQVSGWTPVFAGETFSVALHAQDADGLVSFEYQLEGANETGDAPLVIPLDGTQTSADASVPIPGQGRTTMRYRVRDGNRIWSAWRTLDVRTKLVVDRVTNENSPEEFRVGDPEGTGFQFSVNRVPAGVTFSTATGQFAGTPSFDANDPYSLDAVVASGVYQVVVTETASDGRTSSVGFIWTINHINRHPVITVDNGFSVTQGSPFQLQINGFDPDHDPAVWTLTGRDVITGWDLPPSVHIDPASGLISGTFPIGSDATYIFTVGLSECATQTGIAPCNTRVLPGIHLATLFGFEVSVNDLNDPPDVTNPGDQVSAENQTVSLAITASDPEHDPITFAASGLPPGLTIDSLTGVISGTVAWRAAASYAVTVQVDDHFNQVKRSVTFNWKITHTNRPPTLAIPNRQSLEGETITGSLAGYASDPDNDVLYFVSATGLPAGVVMTTAGALSGSLGFNTAGTYVVNVVLSDGAATVAATFTWIVNDVNRAPTAIADVASATQGQAIVINVLANDTDEDPGTILKVTSVGPASNGTVVISNGGANVTYTATANFVGTATFSYTISDGHGGTATANVTITVRSSNRPPVCTAAAVSPRALWPPNHKPVYVTLAGITDPDGGTPTIKFTSILQDEPTNTEGDGNTTQDAGIETNGTTAWVRAERMGGENSNVYGRVYILGFTASDANGASCSGTVVVGVPHDQGQHNVPIPSPGRWNSITGALVTPPPPIANDDSISSKKGATVVATVLKNDVVYGAAVMTMVSAPSKGTATVNPVGTITYTPPVGWTGSTSFTYRLTNAVGSDTAVVSVTVK